MRSRRAIIANIDTLGLNHKKGHSAHTLSGRGVSVAIPVAAETAPVVEVQQLELKMTPPPVVVEEKIPEPAVVEPTPEPVIAEVSEPAIETAPVAETVIEEETSPASTTEIDAEGKPSKKRGKKAVTE